MHVFNEFNKFPISKEASNGCREPLTTLLQYENAPYQVSFSPPINCCYKDEDEETIFKICKELSYSVLKAIRTSNTTLLKQVTIHFENTLRKQIKLAIKKVTGEKGEVLSLSAESLKKINHTLQLLSQNLEAATEPSPSFPSILCIKALSPSQRSLA